MAEDMQLADMKRSAKEKKDREKAMRADSPMDGDYHYGLRIHLDNDSLEKIGLKDNPKPGDMIHVMGHAKVVRAEDSADENGSNRHVELHFHKLGVKAMDDDANGEVEGGKEKSLRDELSESAKESERRAAEKAEKKAAGKTSTATARDAAQGADL